MIALTIVLHSFLFWFAGAPQQNRPAPLRVNARSPHGPLAIPCDNCHTLSSWKPIRAIPEFDHNRTSFPLRGQHTGLACEQCHASPVFSNAGTTCATCHADIHRGQFGGRCEQCHTEKGWAVSTQSIQNHQNRFPLIGAHAVVECDACHTGAATSQFSGLSTDCLSCHVKDFQSARAPDHQALNFPSSCQSCHSMNSWVGAPFDHLKFTGFALTGAHSSLDCATCHVGGKYQGTPANCYGCHSTDYNTTSNPNHTLASFPTDCQTCHSTATWSGGHGTTSSRGKRSEARRVPEGRLRRQHGSRAPRRGPRPLIPHRQLLGEGHPPGGGRALAAPLALLRLVRGRAPGRFRPRDLRLRDLRLPGRRVRPRITPRARPFEVADGVHPLPPRPAGAAPLVAGHPRRPPALPAVWVHAAQGSRAVDGDPPSAGRHASLTPSSGIIARRGSRWR